MKEKQFDKREPIFVVGDSKLAYSVSVCLLQANHPVTLYTKDRSAALKRINVHMEDLNTLRHEGIPQPELKITGQLDDQLDYKLLIAITSEDLMEKKGFVQLVEKRTSSDSIIAVNTESFPLHAIQEGCDFPERIIGINWVEPAHTTFFLELIINNITNKKHNDWLFSLAREHWRKDPYVVSAGYSIRSRMFAAMAREAFYLVENGYASVEDVDRACRNDAGYYLPFAGNCRYMDLMGTYAYGIVMKELNPDLSSSKYTPEFFNDVIAKGGLGMENGMGVYQYEPDDLVKWDRVLRRFSYQIKLIMERYPFNYLNDDLAPESLISSSGQQ